MAENYISTHTINSILHLIENGSLAIPAFQRGFAWEKENIKQLFESINYGFPIGIIVAIEHESKHFETASSKATLFPDITPESIVSNKRIWILDGSQRLASLYNVFLGTDNFSQLLYDLEEKEFLFSDEFEKERKFLSMSSLFRSRKYMQRQAEISRLSNHETLLEELYELHNRFTSYQVPIQVIKDVSDEDIVPIYMRLNTRGRSLKKDEIEQALKYKKVEE